MKCPVCNEELVKQSFYENHIMSEEYSNCVYGCGLYKYEFSYGSWQEYLGNRVIHGWYNDSKTTRKRRSFVRKQIISRLRKKYNKGA